MSGDRISVNRAPVLALWASVVAERLGHGHEEALSLGMASTGLTAWSRGRRLGLYRKREPVPFGAKGWGAKGVLDLDAMRRLAREK